MQIITHIADAVALRPRAIITVGVFDGVHAGHQHVLKQLVARAGERGVVPVVVTFCNHPLEVVSSGNRKAVLLNTVSERLALLEQYGAECCVLLTFNDAMMHSDAGEFLDEMQRYVNVEGVLLGFNNRFGRVDGVSVEEAASKRGITFERCSKVKMDGVDVSSSQIRRVLMEGNIAEANRMLGRPYMLKGIVAHGRHIGHTIGFPTANLVPVDDTMLIPHNGVYFGVAEAESYPGTQFRAMINIGCNPTVTDGGKRSIEVHLTDAGDDLDLYSKSLTVKLLMYHRDEEKYASLDALRHQLTLDCQACRNAISLM